MNAVFYWIAFGIIACMAVEAYKLHQERLEQQRQIRLRLTRLAEMLRQADRDRRGMP